MSRKSTLSIISRLAPTIFFKLGTMKGDINTYRMVKVPCRLMHWVTLFGPFLGPNLPKNRHFVNFLENGSYDFFKTWNKDGGHQYLSNGKNPIEIDSFPQELGPKTGLMTSSFGPYWAGSKKSMGQVHHAVIHGFNLGSKAILVFNQIRSDAKLKTRIALEPKLVFNFMSKGIRTWFDRLVEFN